jgi:hypothetical protein
MVKKKSSFQIKRGYREILAIFFIAICVGNYVFAKRFSFPYTVALAPNYEEIFQEFRPYLGQCVLQRFEKRYPRFDAFDRTVIPYWERTLYSTSKDANRLRELLASYNLTPDDLVAIDAMARTLYAEMDRGFDHGLHYGRAIAGVVLNRAEAVETQKKGYQAFSVGQHKKFHPLKNSITKVVTARRQFSAWDGVIKGEFNPVLSHALCPPVRDGVASWKYFSPRYQHIKRKKLLPSENELRHWNMAVRVAVEAILDPDRFWANFSKYNKKEIIAGQQAFPIYYYTSGYYLEGERKGKKVSLFGGGRRDKDFKIVQGPAIAGRRDFDERLLRFWAPRKL